MASRYASILANPVNYDRKGTYTHLGNSPAHCSITAFCGTPQAFLLLPAFRDGSRRGFYSETHTAFHSPMPLPQNARHGHSFLDGDQAPTQSSENSLFPARMRKVSAIIHEQISSAQHRTPHYAISSNKPINYTTFKQGSVLSDSTNGLPSEITLLSNWNGG